MTKPLTIIEHSLQRKHAITWGKGTDHSGNVAIAPIKNFDLNKTIFSTLEGFFPRMVMEAKIAKTVCWDEKTAKQVEEAYQENLKKHPRLAIDQELMRFMVDECDFSMEHADGTFLEHLVFVYEYCAKYFPQYSPRVMLLHSILGTATNTFAMSKEQIPKLAELVTDFEMLHISSFPSVFRLISNTELLATLNNNMHRLDDLKEILFYRVIDNQPITMDAENFWIQLNYQLVHFIDFLPAANWYTHSSDPLLQWFLDLSTFLDAAGKTMATVGFEMPKTNEAKKRCRETLSIGSKISGWIPASLKRKLAAKSVQKFSANIKHSLAFEITWR